MIDVESLQKTAKGELSFNPPASEESLNNLAKTFGTYLPDDFREFMSISNGLQDKHGLEFVYPVEEIINLNKYLREDRAHLRLCIRGEVHHHEAVWRPRSGLP